MHESAGVAESSVKSYVTRADEECDSGQQYQSQGYGGAIIQNLEADDTI